MRILDKYILKEFLGPFFVWCCRIYCYISRGGYTAENCGLCYKIWCIFYRGTENIYIGTAPDYCLYVSYGGLIGGVNGDIPAIRFQRIDCYADIRTEL